jgi:hypothetical protein
MADSERRFAAPLCSTSREMMTEDAKVALVF